MKTSHENRQLRCFLGLGFPLAREIRSLQQSLLHIASEPRSKLRVVDESNLHVTLKFLGVTDHESIPVLQKLLSTIRLEQAPIELDCRGLGFFNNSIWLGIEQNESLSELAYLLDSKCASLGFRMERKAYQPHVTVARFNKNARFDLSRLMTAYSGSKWGTFSAAEFNLYESKTLPQGARYSIIDTYSLR
ncbi:MAG: RNA 2',3'-cyclic phosphodiesterase [Gammaproteobacteria bacterium]|nr:RNA 2',3'-cyclic phosphodiesterase [Gammaproteobacteria bacterium]